MKQTTFSFPQIIDRYNKKVTFSSGNKSINECLGILLRTKPGELLGDPNYGCNLIDRVYMYNGVIIDSLIKEDIATAINKYEPRIIVNENDVTLVNEYETLKIYIRYTIKDTGQLNEFNMDLTYDTNPEKIR